MYQSLPFKDNYVYLNTSDKYINHILHSTFYPPGQYVKSISFKNLFRKVGSTSSRGDVAAVSTTNEEYQLLSQLVRSCPKVSCLQFSMSRQAIQQDWIYLSKAITSWKLSILPTFYSGQLHAKHYFECAYVMRDTLTHLDLAAGTIESNDYSILKEFKTLRVFNVRREGMKYIYDCNNMLKCLPQLVEFYVERKGASFGDQVDVVD